MLELQDIQRDLERLRSTQEVLDAIVKASDAFGAVVFETGGEPVVEVGALEGDIAPLAKQLASVWQESCDIARMVGEVAFEETAYLAGSRHLYVTRCGLDHLLAVLYGAGTNLGLVRLYAAPASDHIATLLIDETTPISVPDGEDSP